MALSRGQFTILKNSTYLGYSLSIFGINNNKYDSRYDNYRGTLFFGSLTIFGIGMGYWNQKWECNASNIKMNPHPEWQAGKDINHNLPNYTLSDVQKHSQLNDLWLIYGHGML